MEITPGPDYSKLNPVVYKTDEVLDNNIDAFLQTPIDSRSADLNLDLRKNQALSPIRKSRPQTSMQINWKKEIPMIVNQKKNSQPKNTIPKIAQREILLERETQQKTTIESLSDTRQTPKFDLPLRKDQRPTYRRVPQVMYSKKGSTRLKNLLFF